MCGLGDCGTRGYGKASRIEFSKEKITTFYWIRIINRVVNRVSGVTGEPYFRLS
jgi:hypothetical protein